MRRMRWGIQILFLFLGCILLSFLCWQISLRSLIEHIHLVGWGALPVLCMSILWKACNTTAWILTFAPDAPRPGFWRLYSVNLAGDVVNNMLPTANLGGELAKPYLLRSWMPASQSASAVVANKTMEILTGMVFVTAGACTALLTLPLGDGFKTGFTVAISIGITATGLLCFVQGKRPFSRLLGMGMRLRPQSRRLGQLAEAAGRVDEGLSAFYSRHRYRFLGCLCLRLASWTLGMLETFLILRLMGAGVCLTTAFLLVALPLVIDTALFFVPANMGTSEAGHTYVAALLSLNPSLGLAVALVKRFRRLFWMGVGMTVLYLQHSALRILPNR